MFKQDTGANIEPSSFNLTTEEKNSEEENSQSNHTSNNLSWNQRLLAIAGTAGFIMVANYNAIPDKKQRTRLQMLARDHNDPVAQRLLTEFRTSRYLGGFGFALALLHLIHAPKYDQGGENQKIETGTYTTLVISAAAVVVLMLTIVDNHLNAHIMEVNNEFLFSPPRSEAEENIEQAEVLSVEPMDPRDTDTVRATSVTAELYPFNHSTRQEITNDIAEITSHLVRLKAFYGNNARAQNPDIQHLLDRLQETLEILSRISSEQALEELVTRLQGHLKEFDSTYNYNTRALDSELPDYEFQSEHIKQIAQELSEHSEVIAQKEALAKESRYEKLLADFSFDDKERRQILEAMTTAELSANINTQLKTKETLLARQEVDPTADGKKLAEDRAHLDQLTKTFYAWTRVSHQYTLALQWRALDAALQQYEEPLDATRRSTTSSPKSIAAARAPGVPVRRWSRRTLPTPRLPLAGPGDSQQTASDATLNELFEALSQYHLQHVPRG